MSTPARLTELLGIQYPLIQAPMAGVSTPELAAAVSNAGALGSLGIGASSPAQARAMIERTRSLTANPFNVNVFCHATAPRDAARDDAWLAFLKPLFDEVTATLPDRLDAIYPSYLESEETYALLLELRPAVVSFHFGVPPASQIDAMKAVGIRTLATATNLDEANHAVGAGIDAVIAQGIEAGGHRGIFDPEAPDEGLPTAVLTRLLATSLDVPVITAGGIMDGASIKAALELGASAAQLGTAFILCPESSANAAYRAALKDERAQHTRLTHAISGRPARGIYNRFIEWGESSSAPAVAAYPMAYDANKQLNAAATKLGEHGFAAHWAGQGAPLARELPAAALIEALVREWQGC